MKKQSGGVLAGAIAVVLILMWKFPTFATILSLAFTLKYAIKFVQISKEKKEHPDQKISYVTNIGNKKNELVFDVRKAFAVSIIILALSASFSSKAKSKNKPTTPERAKIEEKQEVTKKEIKEEPKKEVKEEPKKEVKEEKQQLSNEDKKTVVESLIKSQFKEFFDTETETKDGIFYIYLDPKGDMVNDITYLLTNPEDPEIVKAWKGVTDMLSNLSKQAREQIDEEVSINIRNPLNKDNIIYSNASGAEFYNIINDIKK